MCSKKSSLTAILIILVTFSFQKKAVAQVTGDFRSKTSGQWGNTSTWEIFDGAIWNAAGSLPSSSTSVWIQDGNEVTLAANGSCKDLHLNADIDGADNNRLTISTFTLSVFGKLRTYTGAFNTIPGTNSTGLNNSLTFLTTTSGKLQITGTSRDITTSGEWGVPLLCRDFTLEVSMNSSSDVATFKTNFRAGAIVVAVGNLTMDATAGGALRPDGGSAGTGTLTVNSGATLTMNSVTIARTASERIGTFTLNSGGFIVVPSGVAPKIAASTVNLNGTITNSSSTLMTNGGIASAASTNTYNNLTTGSSAITLASSIVVNGTLTLGGKITTSSSNTLTIGASGTISGASASNYIDGPLSMTVAATSKTLNFEIGKSAVYRRVVLNVAQDAATSTVYTSEVFNTAPTSRTFPSGVTSVSNSRYWNITKGAGANLTSSTTAIFAYGSGDGVANHTAIQIVKDDGAGNWVSFGTGGSASLTGTITTTTGFSSLGDFVIGNVNSINNGDFRSLTSGQWGNTSTWETYNSTTGAWVAAGSTPTSSNSVFIQDDHEVTLAANASCKDLNLNADHVAVTDPNRLTISTFTLSVHGRLRTYTGATGNIPGANSTGGTYTLTFLTSTSGKLQITGTSRDVTTTGEWGVPTNLRDFTLEISMNSSSDVATFKTNFRAGTIIVAAGNLTMDATAGGTLRPDGGSAGTGTLTVNSGATLTMNSVTIARTATERFGTFTLNSGGFIVVSTGVAPKIAASTVNLNGTVTNNSSSLLTNGGIASAASTNTYNNLTTGSSAITLASSINVNGTLTLGGKITTSSSNTLTIGASGTISGASSSNFIDGPLSMTVAATTKTLNFETGKSAVYRRVVLNVVQDATTSTVYTTEVFNTAPTSRTFPSGVTNVSNSRYWNITKGAGANLTSSTTAVFAYESGDGIGNHTTIQIVKDDGAGNWVSLGTGGSASLTGTITTSTGFSSLGDFVIGNVNWVNNGDFRSITNGNWSNTATWETYNSTTGAWDAAASTPTSSNSVFIQDGNEVTLTANASCKDLHLNADIDGADNNRLTIATFTLAVSGKLRTYTGVSGNIPGANSTGLNNSLTFLTTTSGKLQITGTSRDITTSGEWGVPLLCRDFTLEVSMNSSSEVATFKTNFRAGAIVVAVGNLTMDAAAGGALRPDGGSAGTGTLTVNSGATLTMNSVTIARTASERIGTFTLNSGGFIVVPSGVAPKIAASTVNLNGTITNNSSSLLTNGGIASAASTSTYNNLTTGSTAITLASPTTVNGTLTLGGKITTSSTNTLTIGASGSISGASSTNFIDGPLSMTIAANTGTLTFEIGKGTAYRQIALNLTHSSATSTVYTAEAFNTAPTSRTIPSGITHVSSERHFNVTKGAGATLTSATIAINFDTDDKVNQASSLRVMKDDGAGNWVNIGNTFVSAVPVGFIISGSFTTFSDFVLGNASGGTNPLPVEWLTFEATKINENINLLKWTTASENNNKGFEVERSIDGKTFNKIDFVEGNETKETVSKYSFTDQDNQLSATATAYYRLKQLDNNGTFSYSEIRAVESTTTSPVINVYPNPAKTVLTIAVSGYTGDASLELTDISGKKLTLPVVNFNRESATQIDISNCKPGIYLLKMITPEKTYTRKIAIQ